MGTFKGVNRGIVSPGMTRETTQSARVPDEAVKKFINGDKKKLGTR